MGDVGQTRALTLQDGREVPEGLPRLLSERGTDELSFRVHAVLPTDVDRLGRLFDYDGLAERRATVESSGLMCRTPMVLPPQSMKPVKEVSRDTSYTTFMRASATGRLLRDPKGGSFWFDAGAVCLDFAHTGGEGTYAKFECLNQPADLADWLAQPPLNSIMTVPVTARELSEAKALRQAIWDAAHAQAADHPLPAEAVATINKAAAAAPLVPKLTDGPTAGWAQPVRAAQALSTLAREMIDLLSGPFAGRIRGCASDNCPMVFVDSSRPGARRWCSMERCGNRNNLRALRARRAAGAERLST